VTNLCDTLGYHSSANSFALWLCGQDFTLRDEHGETHSLYEFRGQVVMLDLSAIWCPPCRSEADLLEAVYQQYKDRGVRFLTVLMDEDNQLVDFGGRPNPAECRNWGDRSGTIPDHTFPCWIDPNDGSKDAWPKYNKWGALPTNVILDQGLRVIYSGAGYDEATIKNKLDRLVGTVDACVQ
jgi:thiol-disulfide isomerase/thioredoxin